MKKNDVVIKGLKIEVGGKVIEVSLEDAEKLYKALDSIYGKKTIIVDKYYPVREVYPVYPQPWDWRDTPMYYQDDNITWSSNNLSTSVLDCKIK